MELGFDNGGSKEADLRLTLGNLAQLLSESSKKTLGYVEYRSIFRDLRSRPFTWWQERVQNNAFEYRNIFNKEGSFTKALSTKSDPAYLKF